MDNFLDHLSENGIVSVLIWILMLIIIGVIYEGFFDKKNAFTSKFLNTRDKEVYCGVIIISLILLLLSVGVSFFHKPPFMWILLSILLLLGGILGFIPSLKSNSKESLADKNRLKKYMGVGGFIGAIITFIGCFLFVYIQDPSSAIVGIIMGLAIGLTGGTFIGIAAGIFIGKYFLMK